MGYFGSFAFDYEAGNNPASGFLGIRLTSSKEQTCFDGIQLTAVPEASTYLAPGLARWGCVGFGVEDAESGATVNGRTVRRWAVRRWAG